MVTYECAQIGIGYDAVVGQQDPAHMLGKRGSGKNFATDLQPGDGG